MKVSATKSGLQAALFLLLVAAASVHGFAAGASKTQRTSSSSQLSMAWTLPTPTRGMSFGQPTWYQDCGNPCLRRVVYDDDNYLDDEPLAFSSSSWSSITESEASQDLPEQKALPRGTRVGRAARRAFAGLRNSLRP